MEYHREHPDQRRGDTVLETWSKADYIAQSVSNEKITGSWAQFSDQLQFLPDSLKRENGKPFCVIQFPAMVLVLWPLAQPFQKCTIYMAPAPHDVGEIKSGDMQFSGRTDFGCTSSGRANDYLRKIRISQVTGPGVSFRCNWRCALVATARKSVIGSVAF
jgi:hypothetical protein